MGKATVVVTAIHNRTQDTITIPHQQRGPISIEPGGSLEGPFIYTYDPEKEGAIPSPNPGVVHRLAARVQVGGLRLPDRGPRLGVQSLEQTRRPSHFASLLFKSRPQRDSPHVVQASYQTPSRGCT